MAGTIESVAAAAQDVVTERAKYRAGWTTPVPIILAGYFVFGLTFAWLYRYQINPDGVSYIQIAQQYRLGHWHHAINGYWGPLISWLLVPFLALNLNPQVAFRLLNWAIGGLTLYGVWRLSRHFELSALVRTVFLFLSALMILTWSVSVITPDLLMACILSFFFDYIISTDHPEDIRHPIVCGLLGGLAFLSKPFAFAFVLLILPIASLWQIYAVRRERSFKARTVLLPIIIGLASFFIVAMPWIVTISNKYGNVTVSTSGSYNLALMAPGAQGQAHYTSGLLPPLFKGAVSEWYDPSFELPAWNPMRSPADLVHEAANIVHNALYIGGFVGLISIVVAGLLAAGLMRKERLTLLRSATGFSFVAVLIYLGLYSLILVESRYLWPVMILLWLGGLGLLSQAGREDYLSRMSSFVLYGLLFFLILVNPIIAGISGKEMVLIWMVGALAVGLLCMGTVVKKAAVPTLLLVLLALLIMVPVWTRGADLVWRGVNPLITGLPQQAAARDLAHVDALPLSPGSVASNVWNKGLYLSYFRHADYYGVLKPGASNAENRQSLADHRIEWFLLWDKDSPVPAYLADYTQTATALDGDLRVFHRN